MAFLSAPFASAQLQLSPHAKISLITIGAGTDLYSSFGHSVLWIYDPMYQLDRAYNYGTFPSAETEYFYIKFLRNTIPYTISVNALTPQLYRWQQENRSVKEQVLDLTAAQKQRIFEYLETNLLPQNRSQKYKFFYDNCSTRLADVLKIAVGNSLIFPGYTRDTLSFRQWIDRYAYVQKPWADFGMDLAIGSPSDEIATPQQATFLPNNLSDAFADAWVKSSEGKVPLVLDTHILYVATPTVEEHVLTPKLLFWTLATLVAMFTAWQIKTHRIHFVFDKILFTLIGFTGWLIVFLWIGTDHGVTSWNWDILWAFPLWVPFISHFQKPINPPGPGDF
ncbi:lipoprotein N-acyltransferase Lnb domain-containing protein [Salmonirosea aquatica]|uniref:lipoprotein N-acyltransferase Lnb domain-containing protein n=1 Tax=Salmonirosea aquatica TaxID=2654236 RepID=UPI0035716298